MLHTATMYYIANHLLFDNTHNQQQLFPDGTVVGRKLHSQLFSVCISE